MTTRLRLRRLEQALPPQVAVRLWLAEAHAHGSLGAYVAWLDEQPPDQEPCQRVRAQAEAATWAGVKSDSRTTSRGRSRTPILTSTTRAS